MRLPPRVSASFTHFSVGGKIGIILIFNPGADTQPELEHIDDNDCPLPQQI
jgi:hypothetical protein